MRQCINVILPVAENTAQSSTKTKLMQDVTSKMVAVAQSATVEASKQSLPWQRAAA